MSKLISYKEQLLQRLRDPEEAAAYLKAAMQDGGDVLLLALQDIAEANKLAEMRNKKVPQIVSATNEDQ